MGGREPKCVPEQPPLLPTEEPSSGIKLLLDSPIRLLLFFHKAIQGELAELRRLAVETSERDSSAGRDLIFDFRGRFEFLKYVYKYHCTAEDEVIFLALDCLVQNVICTYKHEHKSIDDLFDSISDWLNVLLMEKEESTTKQFQEIVFCIGTIQTTICQHMLKEEKQVYPLLMQHFSSKEQASLIWQFLCSVPVVLLEDIFPWLTSFLSPNEQEDIMHCIKEVVPEEKLLQEVVISWLHKNPSSSVAFAENGRKAQIPNLLASAKDILKVYASKSFYGEKCCWKKASCETTVRHNPIDGLHLWHGAIAKDFKDILKDLYQISSSQNFSTLGSVILQLKFSADVLIFYSTILDKFFDPVLNALANGSLFHFQETFQNESQIEALQRLLYHKHQKEMPLCKFVEKLCWELELFVIGINEHFSLLETEVFPLISNNCTHEFQQWLLFMSLQIMPLGLLKCMISWFSARLSEDECNSILSSLKQGGPLANNSSFALLLFEWVSMGCSGKSSIDKFRKDLQEIFKSRSSILTEHVTEDCSLFYLMLNIQPSNSSNPGAPEPHLIVEGKGCTSNSSSSEDITAQKHSTSYSSRINLHVFSPRTLKILSPFPKFPAEISGASSIFNLEPRPLDHIFFFHKALKKDLEYLVNISDKLGENVGDVMDFHRRFQLLRFLYRIHSDSEDEIAFPALEAKGKAPNISQSYTIDHELEIELFNKISLILDEISRLHVSVCSIDMDVPDQRMLNYRQLCLKLHDMCKSMHKVLCDHVHREEIELWPLFRECFSIEEQEKIIGCMLGRTRAEILQEMIPWLMASLTPEEQQSMMSLWRKATKNTMFDEWLGEWWEGMERYDIAKVQEESNISPSWTAEPLNILSTYLLNKGFDDKEQTVPEKGVKFLQNSSAGSDAHLPGNLNMDDKGKVSSGNLNNRHGSDCLKFSGEINKKRCKEIAEVNNQADKPSKHVQVSQDFRHQEHLPIMSQEELEAAIRRISRDSTMDPQKKSYIIQNLLMSRWLITQQKSHSEVPQSNEEEVSSQCPSYRDPIQLTFGCKHYKRNCKLVAACCNRLYTCRLCHDDVSDHSMDRKATARMMCMNCLMIQPIGPTCLTVSCNSLSMAKYYCKICKLFDDERDIYHCPYCNLCRVGKGLGIDYFHCMNCNACMSRSLSVHICRKKCFEDNCPICHEYMFTSSSPVKALPCGHLMHSACFQDYTCTHYTCPICSKSLGDMQAYFGMLDALLAEEKIPEEYSGQNQVILCNDCEKRGPASFHWLYHKCSHCGSYNTRIL